MNSKPAPTIRHLIKVTQAWFEEKGLTSARLDAEVLLAHVLRIDRLGLYLDMDRPLNAQETSAYREAVKRRALKEPIAYIVGHKEFYGLEIDVSPAVLIPRPDTEHLVELALAQIPQDQPTLAIDVCTGSGCVAIALAKHRPHLTVWATEIDPQAHAVALENVKKFHLDDRIECFKGDFLKPCPQDVQVDLLVGNPPYVFEAAINELEPDVRDYEPHIALIGTDVDALGCHRRILVQGLSRVRPDGHAFLEIGFDQGTLVQELNVAGWTFIALHYDLSGHPRVAEWRRDA